MMSRKEELMEYVHLLTRLLKDGFKCEMELQHSLKELHNLMMTEKPKTLVIVLEKNFEGVVKSVETFKNILGHGVATKRTSQSDDHEIKSGNTTVLIFKFDKNTNIDKCRGLRPDYIINNSMYVASELGLITR